MLDANRRANEQDSDGTEDDGTEGALKLAPVLFSNSGLTTFRLRKLRAIAAMVAMLSCCTSGYTSGGELVIAYVCTWQYGSSMQAMK